MVLDHTLIMGGGTSPGRITFFMGGPRMGRIDPFNVGGTSIRKGRDAQSARPKMRIFLSEQHFSKVVILAVPGALAVSPVLQGTPRTRLWGSRGKSGADVVRFVSGHFRVVFDAVEGLGG